MVLVHGFTQTRRSWDGVADDLATDHEVVVVDAPGHGHSASVEADLDHGGRLLAAAGGTGTYVGYSMGGRLCLHAALAAPEVVSGLVVIGATGGIDDPGERAARRADDAARSERLASIGVAAFLDEWLAQPLFAGLDEAAQGRDARLENTVEGLRSSLALAGTGAQRPLWPELAALTMPVLVLAGANDTKFCAAGQRLAATIGTNASYDVVPDAGHTAHLEEPAAFLGLLRDWLRRHGR